MTSIRGNQRLKELERKWWFVALIAMLTTFATRYLLESAGLPTAPEGLSGFAVYAFCFLGVWKMFAGLGWLVGLLCFVPAAPKN